MHPKSLTKCPPGSLKELLFLSTPIFFTLISSNLMLLCDRYFLSLYSLDAFKAVSIASYLCFVFQAFFVRITSINQVFVGRSMGEDRLSKIGPYTWQMIWCSFSTLLITPPIANLCGNLYFSQTEVATLGTQYFSIMMWGNFLFPLGAALAAFQMGRGKTQSLVITALIANLLNGVLDYILINGIPGVIQAYGISGAAVATLISQTVYCLILAFLFIKNPERQAYQIKNYRIQWPLFKEMITLGVPRAFSKMTLLACWAAAISLVSRKGGDYITVIAIGATIWPLMSVISESLGKGLITLSSYFIGQNRWSMVWKSLRSGIVLLLIVFTILMLTLTIWSHQFIYMIIGTHISQEMMHYLTLSCIWIAILFFLEGLTVLTVSLLVSMKQTVFLMKYSLFNAIFITYIPFYIGFQIASWNPDKVWMTVWISCIVSIICHPLKIIRCFAKVKRTILVPV